MNEVFLPTFEAAVSEAHAKGEISVKFHNIGIMAAYSEIDGIPNCANEELLTNSLREAEISLTFHVNSVLELGI